MNDLEKSLISEFIKLGSNQQNAASSYQVYMELTEVRKLFDVNYYFDNNMKRIYLTARNSKSEPESLFFPICTFENISFAMMKQIIGLSNNKSSYLAIISPDSTFVCYQMSDGLIEFKLTPSISKLNQREKHDNEISQKREEIERIANKSVNTCVKLNLNR